MTVLNEETIGLLRAAVLSDPDQRSAQIARLARETHGWDAAIDAADRHGILPILYSELVKNQVSISPRALMHAQREFERNAFHCFANTAELLEILNSFEQTGISAMPFKGVVLASDLYGDKTLRRAGDLDLLIFRRDLEKATELLIERGYERTAGVFPDDCGEIYEHAFVRASDGMVVELRWRLEMSHPNLSRVRFNRDLGMEWVWPHRGGVVLAGKQVPTLSPEHTLLMLCMHGSKHLWSRLTWVVDVARALAVRSLDWDKAHREAKRTGLRTALALGALLAHKMTAVPLPRPVLESCLRNGTASELAAFFNDNLLKSPGQRPTGILPYNIRLMEVGDRLRLLVSERTFRPNALDRAFIKLPKGLESLYYLVRPLRILVDRSAR